MKTADRPNLRIDSDRLWSSLMELAEIGGTEKGGVCRIALTDLDRIGRDLFVRWAKEAGATIKIDQVGNVFARREGRDPKKPPVMTGSHLDTQPTGGKFDGAYGVMAGLEVLRVFHDSNYVTEAPSRSRCGPTRKAAGLRRPWWRRACSAAPSNSTMRWESRTAMA